MWLSGSRSGSGGSLGWLLSFCRSLGAVGSGAGGLALGVGGSGLGVSGGSVAGYRKRHEHLLKYSCLLIAYSHY